jgi:pimeloyl-ACP methyl ester carboxylesterase
LLDHRRFRDNRACEVRCRDESAASPEQVERGDAAMVSWAETAAAVGVCGLLLAAACSTGSTGGAQAGGLSPTSAAQPTVGPEASGRMVDVGGRKMYIDCRGPATPGTPTVVLVSGYHDSSDVWNSADVLSLVAPAVGPPVQDALANSHRVCSYDRPGTIRYVEGAPLTDRTTAVPQPRTLKDWSGELHELLRAAAVPEPYLLVGHSMGGLLVQLYGQSYPEQVAGVVFVDAFSPTVPDLLGDRWPIYRNVLSAPPEQQTLPALRSPDAERIDVDASIAQVKAAPPLPAKPLAVLTKTEPFAGLNDLPGLPASVINDDYQRAEASFVSLAPATPQIIASGSDHYIQFSQPDLITKATELVLDRVR